MAFEKTTFTKEKLMAFNAWSHQNAELLICLYDLITCHRFELIGTFLHAVTPEEEEM